MKFNTKTMLNERLTNLQCEQLPAWVAPRLLAQIEAEASAIAARAEAELRERIARTVTMKTVATALAAGPETEAKKA